MARGAFAAIYLSMKVFYAILVLLGITVGAFAFANSRFGVDSPAYRVVESDGPFEIRHYPGMVVVRTPLDNPDMTESSSFMRLFRYISGSNDSEQKIAMTSPVMTSTSDDDTGAFMSFIVPTDVAAKGAPQPTGDEVDLETISEGRFAVYRFSGRWARDKFDDARTELEVWLDEQGLKTSGNAIVANYDSPFTPPMMRRNEVWFRLES